MHKYLKTSEFEGQFNIRICGSKSESNRLLILKKLFPEIVINNLSTSDDTLVLENALADDLSTKDIHHAGTAMRFLTAYYAFYTKKTIKLTGSQRMQNRPVKILVDALRSLGAKIDYAAQDGYPPLIIHPSNITKSEVELQANVSSQYISALMLSAPKLPDGLSIRFISEITSFPYLNMTILLMKKLGVKVDFDEKSIRIFPCESIYPVNIDVESDWSSASYFYSLVALSPKLVLNLGTYFRNSLQGDSGIVSIYKKLGVKTTHLDNSIKLENTGQNSIQFLDLNLVDMPDIAQTVAVTCLGLALPCKLTGLHTLKIKETDRLVAMKTELEKFGADVNITKNSLSMNPPKVMQSNQHVNTYNDHRMAMSFAPLSSKVDLTINDANVVSKSYPDFWNDFDNLVG